MKKKHRNATVSEETQVRYCLSQGKTKQEIATLLGTNIGRVADFFNGKKMPDGSRKRCPLRVPVKSKLIACPMPQV